MNLVMIISIIIIIQLSNYTQKMIPGLIVIEKNNRQNRTQPAKFIVTYSRKPCKS
jgi:hypothetical protein